jgi:ribosomal protein S3AE
MAQAKRKKRFFNVELPIINKETQLQAYEIAELKGKIVKYDLTRMLKGKSMLIKLKVIMDKGHASSTPIEIKLMPYYLKRMVRKGTNYVEDSFSVKCEDNQLRIKPFLVTRRRVPRAIRKALREKTKEELTNYVKDKKTENIFDEILTNKLQKSLSLKLKKIYPLSLCEIRVLKVEKDLEKKK